MEAGRHRIRRNLETAQQGGNEPILLLEQGEQQVLRFDGGMLQLLCRLLSGGQRFLGTFGESVEFARNP